jgi:hypothetical protein
MIFEGGRQMYKPADLEDRLIDLPFFSLHKSTSDNHQSKSASIGQIGPASLLTFLSAK